MRTAIVRALALVLLTAAGNLKSQAQMWSFTGSMLSPRSFHTATVLANGQVLVAGGRLRGNFNENTAELCGPSSGTFTDTGNLNTGRNSHAAALLSTGEVLILGGQDDVNSRINCLTSAELYNPANGKFTLTGSLNQARCLPQATPLANDKVLIIDGQWKGFNRGRARSERRLSC